MSRVSRRERTSDALMNQARPSAPYKQLRSARSTLIPAKHSRREIELRLTGDMPRYLLSSQ